MARQPAPTRLASAFRGSTRATPRRNRGRSACVTLLLCLAPGLATPPTASRAGVSPYSPRRFGASGMLEPHTGSLLVDYYETYLRDHDIDAFRQHVSARYMEGTLARLIDSPNFQARRAAHRISPSRWALAAP